MKVSLVFDPDPEIGSDPNDPHHRPYRLGEFFDSEKVDVLLLVRQYDEQFEGGFETQIWSSGIWENVDPDAVEDAMAHLEKLPE